MFICSCLVTTDYDTIYTPIYPYAYEYMYMNYLPSSTYRLSNAPIVIMLMKQNCMMSYQNLVDIIILTYRTYHFNHTAKSHPIIRSRGLVFLKKAHI